MSSTGSPDAYSSWLFRYVVPYTGGEPKLFVRHALFWFILISAAALGMVLLEPGVRYPATYASLPLAAGLWALYAGLFRWVGNGRDLAWSLLPPASVATAFGVAYATDGSFLVTATVYAAVLVVTVATAECARRRAGS